MVKAMGMLGNSAHGLPARERHLLYRSCVLPIATYRFRLWFYQGSPMEGTLKLLTQMQCHVAVWITGVFRMSPTGRVQAIAGLLPIHLHLQKLKARSVFHTATLLDTHPTCSLLSEKYFKTADPHSPLLAWTPKLH